MAIAATLAASGAFAMSSPATGAHVHCTVVGGDKLPSGSGGSAALCRSVQHAIAARNPRGDYRVAVTVVSASRLTAEVVVNGHPLPDQRFAAMDRNINRDSIERFAESLAAVIAEAARP